MLPFADAHFDAALLIRVLLYVADPQQALAEAWQVLSPGGTMVVAVQGAAHLAAFWALFGSPEGESADAATRRQLAPWLFDRLDL